MARRAGPSAVQTQCRTATSEGSHTQICCINLTSGACLDRSNGGECRAGFQLVFWLAGCLTRRGAASPRASQRPAASRATAQRAPCRDGAARCVWCVSARRTASGFDPKAMAPRSAIARHVSMQPARPAVWPRGGATSCACASRRPARPAVSAVACRGGVVPAHRQGGGVEGGGATSCACASPGARICLAAMEARGSHGGRWPATPAPQDARSVH